MPPDDFLKHTFSPQKQHFKNKKAPYFLPESLIAGLLAWSDKKSHGVVTQAERLSDMAEKGFVWGVKTTSDVQDAQLALKQARGNLAKARRDYLVAGVTLQWVMGTLPLSPERR